MHEVGQENGGQFVEVEGDDVAFGDLFLLTPLAGNGAAHVPAGVALQFVLLWLWQVRVGIVGFMGLGRFIEDRAELGPSICPVPSAAQASS